MVFLLPLGMMGNNMTLAMALKEQTKVSKLNSKRMRMIYTVVVSKCAQTLPLSHIFMRDVRGSLTVEVHDRHPLTKKLFERLDILPFY